MEAVSDDATTHDTIGNQEKNNAGAMNEPSTDNGEDELKEIWKQPEDDLSNYSDTAKWVNQENSAPFGNDDPTGNPDITDSDL